MRTGLTSTDVTYKRQGVLANLNFKLRMLDLLSQNALDYDGTLDVFEANLRGEVNLFYYSFTYLIRLLI